MRPAYLILSTLFVLSLIGCDSKYVESQPGQVDQGGMTLEQRASLIDNLDFRINSIRNASARIQSILNLLRKVGKPDEYGNVLTPFDLLVEVSEGFKSTLPNQVDKSLYREGVLRMPGAPAGCDALRTVLKSTEDAEEQTEVITYEVESCSNKGTMLTVAQGTFGIGTLDLSVNSAAIKDLSLSAISQSLQPNQKCSIHISDDFTPGAIECSDVDVKFSSTEVATFESLKYDRNSSPAVQGSGKVYEDGLVKGKFLIAVRDGKLSFQYDKSN